MFKTVFDVFTKVVTFTMVGAAVYCFLFFPDASFSVSFIWQLLLSSFLTSLGTLLYTESSLKVTIIKIIIHYIWVIVVVLGCGLLFDWFNPNNFSQILGMVTLITAVFLSVSAVTWRIAIREANKLNDKLMEYQSQNHKEE